MVEAIYFDNNATTAVDERVLERMLPHLRQAYGNPSSLHAFGEAQASAVEESRAAVARLLGARSPDEVVFTSGGTESDNLALFAALEEARPGVVLTSAAEHAAILSPLEGWERRGFAVERVGVGPDCRPELPSVLERIEELGEELRLVSLMWANNETGASLLDAELLAVSRACHAVGATFHVDGVQVPGKLPVCASELGIDLLSISAHKFHGPQGSGALYVRSGWRPAPFPALITGGPQEAERRAGTLNVPGIVGLGAAAELAQEAALATGVDGAVGRMARLRDRLESGLVEGVAARPVLAPGTPRLPNTAGMRFPGVDGELLLMALAAEGLAVSSGAACSAESRAPSHVLLAMGLGRQAAAETVRFSLSRRSTEAEVETALELVQQVVSGLELPTAPG